MGKSSRIGMAGLAAALILALWGCQPAGSSAADEIRADGVRLIRLPDGRRLALRCTGQGSPTVILESGYGGSSLGWYKVQPVVARTVRVCSYDRAGLGLSDPGPQPRDGAAIVRDLDKALKAAGIKGPFVLVGHSAGALYMRLFAARRPGEVVGMVMVDPAVEHQDRRFAAVFGPGAGGSAGLRAKAVRCLRAAEAGGAARLAPELEGCVPRNGAPMAPPSFWRTELSEADSLWTDTSDQVDRIGSLLQGVPMVILSAQSTYDGVPEPARSQAKVLWTQLHHELAARSLDGEVRNVDSGHLIMVDRPQAVTDAVLEMARRVRPAP